eukprot:g45112.t1
MKRPGVQVHTSLKVESWADRLVKKAFSMPAFIGQNIGYGSWGIMALEEMRNVDEGKSFDVICMDFRKASNHVPWSRLVQK